MNGWFLYLVLGVGVGSEGWEEEGWGSAFDLDFDFDFLDGGEDMAGTGEGERLRLLLLDLLDLCVGFEGGEESEVSDDDDEEEEDDLVAAFGGAEATIGVGGTSVTLESEDGFEVPSACFVFLSTGMGKSFSDEALLESSSSDSSDETESSNLLGAWVTFLDWLVVALAWSLDLLLEELEDESLSDEEALSSGCIPSTDFAAALAFASDVLEG